MCLKAMHSGIQIVGCPYFPVNVCYLVMDMTRICFVGIPDMMNCGKWKVFWKKASNCDNFIYITSLRLDPLVSCPYLI